MGILRDMLHIIKDVDVDISEREPRKGTETADHASQSCAASSISEREPRKGTETMESSRRMSCQRWKFQNVNPERGRKPTAHAIVALCRRHISEREPRKGTETGAPCRRSHR